MGGPNRATGEDDELSLRPRQDDVDWREASPDRGAMPWSAHPSSGIGTADTSYVTDGRYRACRTDHSFDISSKRKNSCDTRRRASAWWAVATDSASRAGDIAPLWPFPAGRPKASRTMSGVSTGVVFNRCTAHPSRISL